MKFNYKTSSVASSEKISQEENRQQKQREK
jgi:hypothetical protein